MGTDPLCHAAPPRLGTQSKGLPGPIGTLPCLQGVPACFATLLCAPCLESLARGLFGWRRGCGYWQRGEGGTEAKGVEEWPALNILLTPVSSAPSLCPLPSLFIGLNSFLTGGGGGDGAKLLGGQGVRSGPTPTPAAQV